VAALTPIKIVGIILKNARFVINYPICTIVIVPNRVNKVILKINSIIFLSLLDNTMLSYAFAIHKIFISCAGQIDNLKIIEPFYIIARDILF